MSRKSPYQKLFPLGFDAVRWGDGFWGRLFGLCRGAVLPSMGRALGEAENGAVFSNFAIAAGREDGERRGTMWSDGDCYKYMEALTHVYGLVKDAAILAELDGLIALVAEAQEEDGYISTPMQLRGKERWSDLHDHELYNMGHLLTAACVHHRVTGGENFLAVAVKLGDYLCDVFLPRPPELAHFGFNPSNIMGAVELYRVTGEGRYLSLAETFVDMRGSRPGGKDLNQSFLPLREETQAVGHAVTAGYLYCGATDVYAERGEGALLEALERIWANVVGSKMYVTGGTSALHFGASQRPELGNRGGGPVHEAYGYEYQLPNATAYNETCANIAHAMWGWRMLNLSGDGRYADVMELVLYNSMLSSMSLDGIRFCYTNPLRWYGEGHRLLSQDAHQRWFISSCYCCPTNTARTIASLHNWVYGQSEGALWVHLYGSSSARAVLEDGSDFALSQETDYPWDGRIDMSIDAAPGVEVSVMLRIPGWAGGAAVSVNGEGLDIGLEPGTYAELRRVWRAGDVIRLELPMRPRLVKGHPMAEEIRNHGAVMRGPLVYCLEGADLPGGVSMLEVYARREMCLEAEESDMLGGVMVIKGDGLRVVEEGQSDALYAEAGEEREEGLEVMLIPYYAWNNRGHKEMTVWLPLR